MKTTFKSIPSMRVAFIRHIGPYGECGKAWDILLPQLGQAGWIGGNTQFIGVCHDDPEITEPPKIRYDACVTVDDTFQPTKEVGVQTIEGGEYAMTTHQGPYSGLGKTYSRLMGEWLPRSGRQLRSSPCFEVYLNSPESTPPEDLLTDIYAPLIPKT
jgi:AraC family transcriptional regulator